MTANILNPNGRLSEEMMHLRSVFATVVQGRTAIYISTPLTTGQRATEWRLRTMQVSKNIEAPAELGRREVMEWNRKAASVFAAELRRTKMRVVIDPTALTDIPGWTQDDYRFFWGKVIEEYAAEAIFMDGWQYSNGCAYEFLMACRSGAVTMDARQQPMSVDRGLSLIGAALEEYRRLGEPIEFLSRVHTELKR